MVSLALLVVLETLSPAERAVFVLREAFGLSTAEVAGVLGRTEAAVRQMAHRAREHVHARQPRFDADRRAQREVTERFLAAVGGGDLDALLAALAPDVVLISDGGGRTRAALRPITGADKVARWLVAVAQQGASIPGLRIEVAEVNGWPAIVGWTGVEPFGSISLAVADGRIEQVLVVGNPDKLAGLVLRPGSRPRLRG
jgi:RNA polymerase sigma-70 factor (ECF subfamily)